MTVEQTEDRTTDASVYIAVRRAHLELESVRVRKRVLTPLARALEEEVRARARRPVLFGGFQTGRFLSRALDRWEGLAAGARSCVVFAELEGQRLGAEEVQVVELDHEAPLRMEWVVVCDDEEFSCVLSAWEVPGQHFSRDVDRVFELVWSLEPGPARVAARTCAALARDAGVRGAGSLLDELAGEPAAAPTVRSVWEVVTRVLAHVGDAPGEAAGLHQQRQAR